MFRLFPCNYAWLKVRVILTLFTPHCKKHQTGFNRKVTQMLTQTKGLHVNLSLHVHNEVNVQNELQGCLPRCRMDMQKKYVHLNPNWLKWTSKVMCLWGSMWALLLFSLSSFSFQAWHKWKDWMAQEAGSGRKKMTDQLPSPTRFLWNLAVSAVCECKTCDLFTSSPDGQERDYWMESPEPVFIQSVLTVRLLTDRGAY